MTSPASAQFPWSQTPEPPSGEFRTGRLPAGPGGRSSGDYLAARGARPGPALLLLADPDTGYAAIHGLFRLAEVLDAQRLAGSLLIRLAGSGSDASPTDLLEVADGLVVFQRLRPYWRELSVASYVTADSADVDGRADQMAAASGTPYRYRLGQSDSTAGPAGWMAARGRPAIRLRVPSEVDDRSAAVERVFQGLIDVLRAFGMLEGQLSPTGSNLVQPPAYADSPTSGYWSAAARPGQRIRIDDALGSFRDGQGNELGNLLTNVSGLLLGISDEVWVEPGQPLAELVRPA
jgi:hypothetical protein